MLAAWDAALQTSRELAAMSLPLAELDALDLPLEDEDAPAQRTDLAPADLVEWARATALERLGEGERGLSIVRGWLRPKLDAS